MHKSMDKEEELEEELDGGRRMRKTRNEKEEGWRRSRRGGGRN